MPTYEFRNNETGEIEEYLLSFSAIDKFKEENPHLEKSTEQKKKSIKESSNNEKKSKKTEPKSTKREPKSSNKN